MPSLFGLRFLLPALFEPYCKRFDSSWISARLNKLLLDMPKEPVHCDALKKQRLKRKEKGQKYSPGTVTLQVLGSGARGAPRSLYLFTDQSRYLFNCGEGTQRLAHEHKMKLSKLEHIFVTYPSWENMGGLPGVALTIQDVGVPEITLHGTQGIDDIFAATQRFVVLKNLSIKMADCKPGGSYEDNAINIQYVPLESSKSNSPREADSTFQRVGSSSDGSDDDIDYYAYEGFRNSNNNSVKNKRKLDSSEDRGTKFRRHLDSVSMSYVCRLSVRPGSLCLERCVEAGVPPGPLLGRLKAGEDVVLDNGKVVRSADVTLPTEPGLLFIVVECPSLDYLPALVKEAEFTKHQAQAMKEEDLAFLVVHFSPPEMVSHPEYIEWMEKFSPSTHHLILNESNQCMGSLAVHRIQYKLNLLEPNLFPLLADQGIPIVSKKTEPIGIENGSVQEKSGEKDSKENSAIQERFSTIPSHTFSNVCLRPRRLLTRSQRLELDPEAYIEEVTSIDGFNEELEKLKSALSDLNGSSIDESVVQSAEYPKILFLGTGSCIPNKTRNTSSMILHISDTSSILMDCGEGTYGQLCRFYGASKIDQILSNIRGVYISHLHADHHIGLVGVLKARNSVCDVPLYLFAPKQIMTWLNMYDRHFEKVLSHVQLVPNSDLLFDDYKLKDGLKVRISETLGLRVETTPVRHCPNSFGVALTLNSGCKITYSGDTMPCDSLVKLGMNSDLLIHEATMEDELAEEAKLKLHSTTTQAIDIGRKMGAKFMLLTHFSQRYAKLPRLNESFTKDVGIAFDNMQVSLSDLPKLALLYPALRLMFQEECEELEQKALRRQLKLEREERQRFAR